MPACRAFAVVASLLLFAPAVACVAVESATAQPQPQGQDGTLSPACALLAPCCDRWPEDFRRSCSGPAEVKGPEGESACKAFLSNGTAKAYCPELDILNCSDELRAVMGDACVGGGGDGGSGPAVGLDTFSASNLGTITPPADLADVTIGSEDGTGLCSVETATGASSCLTGTNKLVAKRIGDFDVLFAKSIVVGQQALVDLSGTRPVILVATDRIDVKGMISVGYLTTNLLDDKPRPGVQKSGAGVGTLSGGGAFCGKGGDSFTGNGGGGGGKAYGSPAIVPLTGGSGGSGSSKAGGAMQLVAGTKITIDGLLNANGQDGFRASGGSGGAILIEAPSISGRGSISANGGDGDGNVNSQTGGGAGSTQLMIDGRSATEAYAYGGGGAGRIRLNARALGFEGTLSPSDSSMCTSSGSLAAP